MKSFVSSFRGRLMLLSLTTLAVSLTAYSLILGMLNLNSLSRHINEDLLNRARNVRLNGGPPPPMGDGPQGGGGWGGPPIARGGPPDGGPQVDRGGIFRRPRFIRPDGSLEGGFPGDTAFDPGRLARPGQEVFSETTVDGEPVRVLTTTWTQGGRVVGTVQLARELRDYEDLKHTQFWTWLALTPLALAGSALAASLLTGRAMEPIQQMQKAAAQMGQGDLKTRLIVRGDDELAQLGLTMNFMAANLEKAFADQQASYQTLRDLYESQKRFTADASHELRTPLARLQLATSSALRGPEADYREALETADSSARSMAKLVRELLVLARADAGQLGLRRESVDLRLVVSDALGDFERKIEAQFPAGPLVVEGDADHLERVVANLIENAVRHTSGDKAVSVRLCQRDSAAVIQVEDAGEGIAAEHLPHLFERFYRVDAARARADGGCGLGLAICKSIVDGHGGSMRVESEEGKGTLVEVLLPLQKI